MTLNVCNHTHLTSEVHDDYQRAVTDAQRIRSTVPLDRDALREAGVRIENAAARMDSCTREPGHPRPHRAASGYEWWHLDEDPEPTTPTPFVRRHVIAVGTRVLHSDRDYVCEWEGERWVIVSPPNGQPIPEDPECVRDHALLVLPPVVLPCERVHAEAIHHPGGHPQTPVVTMPEDQS